MTQELVDLNTLPDEQLLTIPQVCKYLTISRPTLYRAMRNGWVTTPVKFGKSSRYKAGYVRKLRSEGFGGGTDE